MPRRAALAVAAGAAGLSAFAAGALWLLRDAGGMPAGALLPAASGAAAAVAVAALLLWALLALAVFRPLVAMLRDAALGREVRPAAGLEPLAGDIAALAGRIGAAEARADALEAAAAADPARRRLEAILRDLSEGVVVCNRAHQVLLYNRVALWLLGGTGEVGLGRPLFATVDATAVRDAFGRLLAARMPGDPAGDARGTASLVCTLHDGIRLEARMALVGDAAGGVEGYVLTLAGAAVAGAPPETAARPEFYDFDLFRRPVPAAGAGDAPLRDLGFVVFDAETTGLRPADGDALVSLAAVRVRGTRVLTGERYATLINPGRPIPATATRIHGITDAMVADAPAAAAALPEFRRFVGDDVLVAHNAAFDMAFLNRAAAAGGPRFDMPVLDTLLLSVAVHDHADDHTLDGIAARLGVTVVPGQRHTAHGDALATAQVLARLVDLLADRGVRTLGDALAAGERQTALRRRQQQFAAPAR